MKTKKNSRLTGALITAIAFALTQGTPAWGADRFTLETAHRAAEKGNPGALYFLGKSYAKGNGVPQDYVKAADYLQQSAEKGYAFAQNDLGAMYAQGLGVKQDDNEAAKWFRKAAENGDSLAQFSLGLSCYQGRGVPQDIQQSLSWYKKAAKQKQPDAMLALGDIFMSGAEGVPMDRKEAIKWFRKAEKMGRAEALNSLGFIYEQGGGGVNPDLPRAFRYYSQAADKGDAKSQTNLGRLYKDGVGVEKDRVEAYKWFLLAAQHGDRVADRYRMEMEGFNPLGKRLLTSEQFAEARRRADDWQEVHEKKVEVQNSTKKQGKLPGSFSEK